MIKQVRGTVLSIEPAGATVDVSGFGIFLYMASTEGLSEGSDATVLTHMAVKQDGIELYGFTDEKDLALFTMFLTVSGIGPKTALSILTRAPRESLEQAIATRDITYLTRIAGLSKKAAEKLAVELSEKIEVTEDRHQGNDAEVFDTLVALGYTEREARKALAAIPLSMAGRDERLKAALSAGRS
ncbi:MAG: Holliday junction branch migration protein RuvA [Candidatus Pacebacteria bacterium]|nr:Holliday junction branch migration protein RuvA [Candidatus Paceibacterota bacterium]